MPYRRRLSPAALLFLFLEGALAVFVSVGLYGDGSNGMCDFATQDLHRHVAYALWASLPATWALLYLGNTWLRYVTWAAAGLRLLFGTATGTLMLIAGGTSLC
ncbi:MULTISPECIES: hypothetical protein [unclassified Streptomyces]|uniref:hypothetical protein n=1 Tax=unclassified Streptomyces TaxID=2593676 RepID=UPI00190988A8|nr:MULTISPECIES: hypothetical protein [unclassified Streptomyces]MBK3569816.1 hypothetical protein [Streptomyces sp. MBT62]MBK6019093.1 hypothetical protein [Streptomyces sp. MBT53]